MLKISAKRYRRFIKNLAVGLITSLGVSVLAAPAQAASGNITAEFIFQYNGTNTYSSPTNPDLSIPSGANVTGAINYACLNVDCLDGQIDFTVPAGFVLSNIIYPAADVASVANLGTAGRSFILNRLTAGSSGQITFNLATPGLTIPDGTTGDFAVDTSTELGTTNISTQDTFQFELLAGTLPALSVVLASGGSIDQRTTYDVNYCVAPPTGKGLIQVSSNSTITVTIPAGVSNITATGGTINQVANTITYSLANPVTSGNCGSFRFFYTYATPTFNPGDPTRIEANWDGQLASENTNRQLEVDVLTGSVLPAANGATTGKNGTGPRAGSSLMYDAAAGIGDNAGWYFELTNNGTTQLTDVSLTDSMPDGYKTTRITANNTQATSTGTIRIKTLFGADGVDGSPDDGVAFLVKTVSANASEYVDVYTDTGLSGLPLDPADRVLEVAISVSGFQPGWSGVVATFNGEVLGAYDNGTAIVPNQAVLNNSITGTMTSSIGTTALPPSSAMIQIDVPVLAAATVTAWRSMMWHEPWDSYNDTWPFMSNTIWDPHIDRSPADGVLTTAERTQWIEVTGSALDVTMPNPRLTLVLPRGLQYLDHVSCSTIRCPGIANATMVSNYAGGYANMPLVSLSRVDDYDTQGATLLTFTLSPGATLAPATNWSVWVKVYAGTGLYGSVPLEGFMSSTAGSPDCRVYTTAVVDVNDLDQDGQTNDVICKSVGYMPMPSIPAASITPAVKGSWDQSFASAPTAGYTAPGSNDTLRARFINTGTTGLKEVKVVTTFARPGDDGVVTSTARNSASNTFPMKLRGIPTFAGAASGLTPQIKWTTDPDPCLQAVGNWQPAGCTGDTANWSDWSTTPPSDPSLVTAVLVDFDMELSEPGEEWDIDFPVTTPSVGASEADFAIPSPNDNPANYESAAASFGFIATPFNMGNNTLGLPLSKSESVTVDLQMPSPNGPNATPNPQPYTTVAYKGQTQRETLAFPSTGRVTLVDGNGTEVTTLTVNGVGTYTLNTTSGEISFVPRPSYVGYPPAINYRVYNFFGLSADSTYRPRVRVGTAVANPLTSSRTDELAHDSGLTPPVNSTVRLVDASGNEVTSLYVPNKGTFSVGLVTGQIGFVPVPGFVGTASATYRLTASDGSSADNNYFATVSAPPTPTPTPTPTSSATPTPTPSPSSTTATRTYKKTIRLYFSSMSPELTKGTKIKLARLPRSVFKAKVLGFVQGKTPAYNHYSLSKARATNVAKWLKKNRNAPTTTRYARGISKYSDWRGRSVTLTVWYRR